jgi:hypothetical protein
MPSPALGTKPYNVTYATTGDRANIVGTKIYETLRYKIIKNAAFAYLHFPLSQMHI